MAILHAEQMVPHVYPNESRDFQLLLRYYDYLINGMKHDVDQIKNVIDTEECNSKILYLLQSKVGFFSNAKITDDELRQVLAAFPYIIKNKGSLKAVSQAVNVFCRVHKIVDGYRIVPYNNGAGKRKLTIEERKKIGDDKYVILIEILSSFQDTTILDEIFKYILPPAYKVVYMFMSNIHADDTVMDIVDRIDYEITMDGVPNMMLYNTKDYLGEKYWADVKKYAIEKHGNNRIRSKVGSSITSNYTGENKYFKEPDTQLQVVTEDGEHHDYSTEQNIKIVNYPDNTGSSSQVGSVSIYDSHNS